MSRRGPSARRRDERRARTNARVTAREKAEADARAFVSTHAPTVHWRDTPPWLTWLRVQRRTFRRG